MRIYCFGINLIFTYVIIFAGMVYQHLGRGALHHGCRITDFAYKMLILASRTLEAMQYLGAVLLRPAGVGVGRLRRQDDIEEALAVRRRWWWRRPRRGRVRVFSVRDGVLLVPRAVDVFL